MWQFANLKPMPQVMVEHVVADRRVAMRRNWIETYVRITAPVLGHEFAATQLRHPDIHQVEARLLRVINARRIRLDIHDVRVVVTEYGVIVYSYNPNRLQEPT